MTDQQAGLLTEPFTDAHAIVWVDFSVHFGDALEGGALELLQQKIWLALEPEEFAAADDKDEYEDEEPGLLVAYRRRDADGALLEVVRLHADQVHIAIYDYRGWDLTRRQAMTRLGTVLEMARRGELAAARLELSYRDAFVRDERPHEYEPSEVFKPSQWIPAYVFDAGPFWYHQFMVNVVGGKDVDWTHLFSRIQVDARMRGGAGADSGDAEYFHTTEVTHRQILFGNPERGNEVEWDDATVKARLDHLHDRNKALMLDVLSEQMIDRIGLKESSNE